MSERCEAFVPESTEDKEARYGKFGGHLHPISRWILSMYENPTDTWSFYSSHLDALQERIKMRRLFTSVLPIQDLDAARGNTQFIRQRDYLAEKASSDARPRFGTLDYMVKQASGGEQAGESSE